MKVIGLQYDELVPGPNNTFGTTMSWQKPLFTHSGVKHYRYKVLRRSAQLRRKRDTNQNTALETVSKPIIDIPSHLAAHFFV